MNKFDKEIQTITQDAFETTNELFQYIVDRYGGSHYTGTRCLSIVIDEWMYELFNDNLIRTYQSVEYENRTSGQSAII